jgi:hypothetical protein
MPVRNAKANTKPNAERRRASGSHAVEQRLHLH